MDDDRLIAFRAQMDQAAAAGIELARAAAMFYGQMIGMGVPDQAATAITVEYVAQLMSGEPDEED